MLEPEVIPRWAGDRAAVASPDRIVRAVLRVDAQLDACEPVRAEHVDDAAKLSGAGDGATEDRDRGHRRGGEPGQGGRHHGSDRARHFDLVLRHKTSFWPALPRTRRSSELSQTAQFESQT